jgi:hypothetical protein
MMTPLRLWFCILALSSIATCGDVAFRKSRLGDAKGKQPSADVIFSDSRKSMIVSVADHTIADIPYNGIDKLSYEYSTHHRIKQGAVVMVASLGAGAVVMLTKSKTHWLTVEYHADSAPKTLVLRMDKKEYKNILSTAKAQTGKDVAFLTDGGIGKRKAARKAN